jgi:16S rRNA U516 pseudouridylate synthase RsuA-like enzyme
MCDAVGLDVHTLHRVRIGNLMLGSLSTGFWRFASETDIAELTYSTGEDGDGDEP